MGPKFDELLQCKPEQVGTTEHGKKLKRIQVLEDDIVPAQEAKKLEDRRTKKKITKKENRRLVKKFEMEGGLSSEKRCCRIWRSLPNRLGR